MSQNSDAIDAVTKQLTDLTASAPAAITSAIAAANAAGVAAGEAEGDPALASSIGNLQAAASTLSSAVDAVLPSPPPPPAPAPEPTPEPAPAT